METLQPSAELYSTDTRVSRFVPVFFNFLLHRTNCLHYATLYEIKTHIHPCKNSPRKYQLFFPLSSKIKFQSKITVLFIYLQTNGPHNNTAFPIQRTMSLCSQPVFSSVKAEQHTLQSVFLTQPIFSS